jgi:hypothetical protein
MKETLDRLNDAGIYWEMQASTILVSPEDRDRVSAILPLVLLERFGNALNIRYDLPHLVAEELPAVQKPKTQSLKPKA